MTWSFAKSCAIGCLFAVLFGGAAFAQEGSWPRQPIKIISPWPTGGVGEFLSRTVGEPLSRGKRPANPFLNPAV